MTESEAVHLKRRGRLQVTLGGISVLLTLMAAIMPAWIEEFTGLEPDGGSGELEWLLAVLFAALSIVFGVLALRTRRQLAALSG